ncbi:DUF4197 family protein [Duganella sp. FT50W]|uniref:DUF4197 family protein n=1 Tax=Duganella lactea TaxID=2692173 RepID=A0A6L8MLP8_9BURK|nr:DUF4197 domain-containing protein [Duganella lactea]MYM83564.1 DUF4197 family protein [Duganella lactea]
MPISRRAMALLIPLSLLAAGAGAISLDDLSSKDASGGLKAALETGANAAVSKLGVDGGFLNNDKVRIALPKMLEQVRPLLKLTGKSQQLDDLVVQMNHAAEAAVPMAKPLLLDAVKSMTITDAKQILTGGDTSVTDFFRAKTQDKLALQFQPVVKQVTDKSGLATKYNTAMGLAPKLGALAKDQATVEGYVTQRALDGLYTMIAEEEKAIRADPLGTGSKLIGKVFGAIK